MPAHAEFAKNRLSLSVAGVALDIATIQRDGALAPILFLHGFGSTKDALNNR
jgi:hypothetical protein